MGNPTVSQEQQDEATSPPLPPPPPPPHVLIFPIPLQGPINCMLKLAEMLCLAGLRVTFLNTLHNHRRLLHFSGDTVHRFSLFPGLFLFETFPDGLPEDNPRSTHQIIEVVDSLSSAADPVLRKLLAAADCFIADGIFGFAVDLAAVFGVPIYYFDTISPCALWVHLCLPKLIQAGELPFCDDDLGAPIRSVGGMEEFLRRRDLPEFCRSVRSVPDPGLRLFLEEGRSIPLARGLILNTFEELETPEVVSHMRGACQDLYLVGPMNALLKHRRRSHPQLLAQPTNSSLWEEDRSCIAWLDAQPPRSVVYVSIGSLALMSQSQVVEFWHGLVNSGYPFLWVRRPGSITTTTTTTGKGGGAVEETAHDLLRGRIVGWAPQEEVLEHPSVGAFLTHSGWNSTLEGITAGVPMICWPYFFDQQTNSRHVSHVWKLGLDMKDTCDRSTVESMIREVMEVRRREFIDAARSKAKMAEESVMTGGSSCSNLDRLIMDIRMMATTTRP